MKLPATQSRAAGRLGTDPKATTRRKPSDALRWARAGFAPTRDAALIRQLASGPGVLAIALNPPSGPLSSGPPPHPARLLLGRNRVAVSCASEGLLHVWTVQSAPAARTAALEAALLARSWQCSFAVLDVDEGVLS